MQVTKYEHSCLVIEEQGEKLVIDPGRFSTSFSDYGGVAAVVITHIHGDHFDETSIARIVSRNPDVRIFSTPDVTKSTNKFKISATKTGQKELVGPFVLDFYGGDHELYTGVQNIAVLVNDKIFHPGDSYTLPNHDVEILGAPASAPWLRMSEATKYIQDIKARTAIPIHNSLLSEIGESIHYRILSEAAEKVGTKWQVLKPGQSITI